MLFKFRPGKMLALLLVASACSGGVPAVEESELFEKVIDPVSGVVSYALKYGAPDDNRQSLYFISKSMTEDGRYLVFNYTEGNERKGAGPRHFMLADLKTSKVYDLGDIGSTDLGIPTMTPFIETKLDYMVYGTPDKGFFRRNFSDPEKEVFLCKIPQELTSMGEITRLATHLTLTRDRKNAFLDVSIISPDGQIHYLIGLLNLETGAWDSWGETGFYSNHGQLNPVDDSMALISWEAAWDESGQAFQKETGWYPRMWLVRKGEKELIPARAMNFASHEIWDDDGKGLSWCGHGYMLEEDSVYHHDLATGEQELWCRIPGARHNNCSPNGKYVVCDQSPEEWWRGCKWRVAFWNRETEKYVWIYTTREPLMPKDHQSVLHPDPHPHFVMNGRYVVSTANNADGHMDLYITPVDQLVKMTE